MLVALQLRLYVSICLVACAAAADAGDDFNNLLTDLAPYAVLQHIFLVFIHANLAICSHLGLFGERVVMQFRSQSTGWADNIILAMAPLGIITAIVAVIRVGGPSWLKAIIGRALESRAVAESELMSSTSKEVCELWNGQQIVRVMGSGPTREFIIISPKGSAENPVKDRMEKPTADVEMMRAMELSDPENSRDKYLEKHGTWCPSPCVSHPWPNLILTHLSSSEPTVREYITGKLREGQDPESGCAEIPINGGHHRPVTIIRNTTAPTANLTLNLYNPVSRGEIYLVAMFGIALQLGVLVYSGFATHRLMLGKDGNPVAGCAFPCTISGTLMLVAGMLLCAYVVESSTSETRYRPGRGREARIVWLQKSEIVSDQAFESFAIFPQDTPVLVTTSHRKRKVQGEDEDTKVHEPRSKMQNMAQEAIATVGAAISIFGFIVQFTGLRGMHWSVSVTQLGAIIIMTSLRAWVRRNLAKKTERSSSRFWPRAGLAGDDSFKPPKRTLATHSGLGKKGQVRQAMDRQQLRP